MSSERFERTLTVTNPKGIHARPAALIAQTASRFKSKIRLIKEDQEAGGHSVMEILVLCVPYGTEVTLVAEGPDAEEALHALEQTFEQHFHDD